MKKGLVSVVIPNYNYANYLRETIDAVLSQTYRETEIIVVDDGSTDSSRAILESYAGQVRPIFQKNRGVAAARNSGVRESEGEFIAFLDADDAWEPEKLDAQIGRFRGDPELGLVHVGVAEVDDKTGPIRTRLDGGEGEVWRAMLELSTGGILGGGSGVMVPRDVFDGAGGFDERLSTSADWDFYYRISRQHKVGFVLRPLLKYRVHGSNMHGNIGAMEHDMMLAFDKAFSENSPDLARVKRRAYGCLHQNLAGSYFASGNYFSFLRHSLQSLTSSPRNIKHFLRIPKRRK